MSDHLSSNQQFTPGPWGLRGVQVRADNGRGQHVATYQVCRADGVLLAAAPRLLEMLVNACESLDAAERAASEHCTARDIREELAVLGLRAAYNALKEADDKRYGIGSPADETTDVQGA